MREHQPYNQGVIRAACCTNGHMENPMRMQSAGVAAVHGWRGGAGVPLMRGGYGPYQRAGHALERGCHGD
jgi:hypothetical protein